MQKQVPRVALECRNRENRLYIHPSVRLEACQIAANIEVRLEWQSLSAKLTCVEVEGGVGIFGDVRSVRGSDRFGFQPGELWVHQHRQLGTVARAGERRGLVAC